jgi:predicted transcriptional regulator
MKHIKTQQELNEAQENLNISDVSDSKNEQELIDMIKDIIDDEVYLRYVPYSMKDGDMEKDPDSVKAAAEAIVNMLKKQGLI